MRTVRKSRILICLLSLFAIGLALTACGGSGSSSSSTSASTQAPSPSENGPEDGVDVGTGKPIPVTMENLKIAYVAPGLETGASNAQKRGIEKVAAKYGIPVESLDGELDLNRQYSLYQTTVDSGKANAIVTLPLGGDQDCDILSKTAPDKGIIVSIMNLPICGREFESAKGEGLWQPGTLDSVGVVTTTESMQELAQACEKETGGGEMLLINGASGIAATTLMSKAYGESKMKVAADYATNYATAEAAAKTSAGLLAHPDIKVIATQYTTLTEGAIQALKSAGKKPGVDVKLCSNDGGGTHMVELLESGEVTVDNYVNNEWMGMAATQSIIDAVEGKSVPRVIDPGEEGEIIKSGLKPWPPVITKATVGQYPPVEQ